MANSTKKPPALRRPEPAMRKPNSVRDDLIDWLNGFLNGDENKPAPAPAPTPTPAPAPPQPQPDNRSGAMTFTPATPGAMADISGLSSTAMGHSGDFTPENPGSFAIQNSADYRQLLNDVYTGIPADVASQLELIASTREFDRTNTLRGCDALKDAARLDTDIAIAKLGARDYVSEQQLRRTEAVGKSLEKQFGLAEKYTKMRFATNAALNGSVQEMKKTAAQYGVEFKQQVWGG